MSAILLLALCLGLGVALAHHPRLPPGTPAALNFWVVVVALPALILNQIPKLHFNAELLFPALAPWLVFGGAAVLFPWLGRRRGWSRGTVGALVLTCGLGNTAFMGLAMIESLRGPEALGPAVIADQLGSFVALAVGGVIVAAIYSGEQPHARDVLQRLFTFAPFLALLVAFALRFIGSLPDVVDSVLQRISLTLTPLALFSVGLQLHFEGLRAKLPKILLGLSWKMALAPLLVFAASLLIGLRGPTAVAGILQCAMAPMVTAGILAGQHDLDPPLANLVVGVGTLLSLATIPLAALLL